jgi:hypothetical protein
MAVTSTGYQLNKQPIAQSFYVDEVNGVYCTKVDLYFKSVPDASAGVTLPVQIQVRPMINGFPSSSEIIPGSIVSKASSAVNENASGPTLTPTTFTFDEPIFLKGKEDYALVVIADSKDYEIFIAEINEFIFGSTAKRVNKQPTLGSLFYSQNGVTFTPSQNQDLTFRLHQAKFKNKRGTAIFHNASVPKRKLNSNPIITTNGSGVIRVKHENSGFQVGNVVKISGVDSAGVGGIVDSALNGDRTITGVDFTGYTFTAGAGTATSDAIGGGDSCLATKNIPFNLVYPHTQILQPKRTYVAAAIKSTSTKSYAGTETSGQKQTDFQAVKINENNIADTRFAVLYDSQENITFSDLTTKSVDFRVNLTTADSNVSPLIDTQRMSLTLCDNIVDKQASTITTGFNVPLNFVNETSAVGGSAAARHFTKVINLETDAVGLKVLLSANRPPEADFELYFRSATSDENINDNSFTLINAENVIPADNSVRVFREYSYLIGGQGGNTIPSFTKFQLKIIFRSTNQAKVARIRDLRVIALSV